MKIIKKLFLLGVLSTFINYGSASEESASEEKDEFTTVVSVPAREEENVKGNSAFTIDEYGNTEFFGDVKIKDHRICSVPIGTVIDWWRPSVKFNVPQNFSICDGSDIKDPERPFKTWGSCSQR